MYLCEYIGTFPDDVESHGNSLSAGTQYIRTRPDVLSSGSAQKLNKEFGLEYNIDMFSFRVLYYMFSNGVCYFLITAAVCLYVYNC